MEYVRENARFDNRGMRRDLQTPTGSSSTATQIKLFEVAGLLLRHRTLLLIGTVATMVVVAVYSLMISNRYTSRASILPTGTVDQMSELKSLAGISSIMMSEENSSALFPVILRSELVRDALLAQTYSFQHKRQSVELTLTEYFDTAERDQLRHELGEITTITADKKTGVIELTVETRYPGLSQAVLQAYIEHLERYNLHKRRSQARNNAQYLARQLEQATDELTAIEDSLCAFQLANANWSMTSDPEILRELGRLQREVEIKNTTRLYLVQQLESAKLEAQKDVPIVRILDHPSRPTRKSGPSRSRMVFFGGLGAFLFLSFYLIGYEIFTRRAKQHDREAYLVFRSELNDAMADSSRILNLVKPTRKKGNAHTPSVTSEVTETCGKE